MALNRAGRGRSDPHRYVEPINILDVERRMLRACKTLRAVPDPDARFKYIHNAWPDYVRSKDDAYGYTEAAMPRFRPSPKDVGDMLVALAWARVLEHNEFRLIWWRSLDLSFRQMALRIHRSDETARNRYREAILRAWHAANCEAQSRAG